MTFVICQQAGDTLVVNSYHRLFSEHSITINVFDHIAIVMQSYVWYLSIICQIGV